MKRTTTLRFLRMALLTLLGIGIIVFMAALDKIFAPLLFSLLLAYILNPVVKLIMRLRVARAPAIVILFLLIYGFMLGFLFLTVPTGIRQVGAFADACVGDSANPDPETTDPADILRLDEPWGGWVHSYLDDNGNEQYDPGYVLEAAHWLSSLKKSLKRTQPEVVDKGMEQLRTRLMAVGPDVVPSALAAVGDVVASLLGFLTVFILVPIYLYYFLMGLSGMRDRVFENLPGRYRDRIIRVLTDIDEAVSAFFRGRLIIMLLKGVLTAIGLMLFGVPFALIIGLVTAIASLIPIAGFLMGMIPAVGIALLDTGSVGLAAAILGMFVVIEVVENYFLTPWILKDRVHLHPITLVVSVFVGEALFGFVGMLLAIPITSVMKILFREFVRPQIRALVEEGPPGHTEEFVPPKEIRDL